jgi:hypothetical protein
VPESPDVVVMQAISTSRVEGVAIVLAVVLLVACSINLLLLCAWL